MKATICSLYVPIILFKDFDEKKSVFEGESTKAAITEFVQGNSLPLLVDFKHETASKIFSGDIKSHLLIFLSKEAGHYDEYSEIARSVAKSYKGQILFVTINTDEEDHGDSRASGHPLGYVLDAGRTRTGPRGPTGVGCGTYGIGIRRELP